MQIEIRGDRVRISGYVNAVGRDSRPIPDRRGTFVEQVEPGAFKRALSGGEPVELRLNHGRVLGSTADGALSLREDAIGLRAEAEISDPEAVETARKGDFLGWSFGFSRPEDRWEDGDPPRRFLRGFALKEVSLIDRRMRPCYAGTLVEVRGEEALEYRGTEDAPETVFLPDYGRKARILRLKRSDCHESKPESAH